MIRMSKGMAVLWVVGIVIICLLVGLIIGCCITPGSIVRTETKVVTEPCKHIKNGLIEQSVTPHCDDCDSPAQRILYDSKNEITYVYTFFYDYRKNYDHSLQLKNVEILRIQKEGDSSIMKR